VALVKPVKGGKPIEISKDFLVLMAQTEASAPKWQLINFKFSNGFFNSLAACTVIT
jgi:hypothetical protein